MKNRTFVAATVAVAAAAILAETARAAGLGPDSYVQSGLVTQFDAIDNEDTGTHNSSAAVWRDLKGSASITLQSGASWTGRYADIPSSSKQMIIGMPHYIRDSLTLETAINIADTPITGTHSLTRFLGRATTDCFYWQQGHIYWYFGFEGADKRPHAGGFSMGTISGYSGSNSYGIAFDGVVKAKFDQRAALGWYNTDDGTSWYTGEWYLNEYDVNTFHGHFYAVRFYNRSLSESEMMTNAVVDKLRFFSFKYDGANANWSSIAWDAPESTAATPPTAPSSSTNDYVQIIGSQVTVASSDTISLMGLSLEDSATLDLPSGFRAEAKVLYVDGQPVKKGLYSGDGVGGVQVSWLAGSGVLAVAGSTDGSFPTGTYVAPDANGYYVFGRTSANGGATGFGTGWTPQPSRQCLWLSAECPEWGDYFFPEGSKLKLVGYVLLKTIPAGVFSEIDLSEAEHIVLYNTTATEDGSTFVLPSGVELRYQPAGYWNYRSDSDKWWMPQARTAGADAAELTPLAINGTLRVFGDGEHLKIQQYNGAVSGSGTIQFGNYNNAARFSGPFTFKGTASGFNPANLLWVDTLDVEASLGNVTLHGGPSTPSASNNSDGIFFGRDGSGETANGELEIGTLYGGARSVTDGNSVRWRMGGALAVWGGNTIHVDTLKSALHVVGRPQDLGCTWEWFGSASAVGNGNVAIDDADFIGSVFLSTNVNVAVGNVSNRVTFDYTFHSDAVNATTLDIIGDCDSNAVVTATDLAMLPARLSGFAGSVSLTDTATKSFTVPMDFSRGTDALYNTVGCIGSGTLASAPTAGTLNVTFDTTTIPVEGNYAVARFTSGGELLSGWTVTLNGAASPSAKIAGNYNALVQKDASGIWLKVAKVKAFTIIMR